jgi:L-ornithine N5-oxygenase
MGASTPVTSAEPVDVLGIGFGPSNLALAIAVDERNATARTPLSTAFLERQPWFGWHRDMLIEGSTMQISYLKDLVTLRNPTSPFSFLAYLHARGRLVDFVNHQLIYPTRVEFHDYLEWAASSFADRVAYDSEVTEVRPVLRDDEVVALDVHAVGEDGVTVRRARAVVLATGLVPRMPDGVRRGDRVWHSSELLARMAGLGTSAPRRFVVVGAGQSAAEVTAHLHSTFPAAEVHSVFSRYGYTAADDSSFANRIFDPIAVDDFYRSDPEVRRMLMDYHSGTNYAVVDRELISELYRREYQERVTGNHRLHFHKASRPVRTTATATGVRVEVEHLPSRTTSVLEADHVVFATGYRHGEPDRLLGPLEPWLSRGPDDLVEVGRDFRVVTDSRMTAGLYLQGATEHLHGITTSLLSTSSVRAGEIAASLAEHAHADRDSNVVRTQPRHVLGRN